MAVKPVLAVFLVGDDPVSVAYVALKEKLAREIGVDFRLFKYEATASQEDVIDQIKVQGSDPEVSGIMVQIPLPAGFDRKEVISAISPSKDVDGLRFCVGLESDFLPPVVLAIEKALNEAKVDLSGSNVVLVGQGFLVGEPLSRYLGDRAKRLVCANSETRDLAAATRTADVIISATGQPGVISPEMVKEGVVLIDAGTSEVGGELKGDVDVRTYMKSSYYTPVPGGIGPVTVAMLLENLVK
jgi:methylenetetrahydrofolate dehydrogenase (NADP+)/methenyltetrahydrofolate cyclohydrolase